MDMQLILAWPPNIDQIDAALGARSQRGVLFTLGDRIYNPHNVPVPPELVAHEAVHCHRQGTLEPMIERWWERYCADPEFRLREEFPAHVAEYRRYCERHADPNKRARFLLTVVAKRLSSPLYGGLISHLEAMRRLREAAR